MRAALVAFLILIPAKTLAGPPSLMFPLQCKLGETCFIQQYVDSDASGGIADYTCGPLSYEGHKGTDIRLAHQREIKGAGVAVHASAAGTIRSTRNIMADIAQGEPDAPDVSTRECGNGVVIDHGQGWQTQYCHMRKGSVTVSKGQKVQQGDVLGRVGLSGLTQFAHVHIKVSQNGKTVDPFNADALPACGAGRKTQLWQTPIAYQPGGFLSVGFASAALDFQAIKYGPPDIVSLPADAPAIVVWGFLYGLQQGDALIIQIRNPDGTTLLEQTASFKRNRAHAYRLAGKRRTISQWPIGLYAASIELHRKGKLIAKRGLTLVVK